VHSAAAVEERFLVPTYASRWSPLSVAAHRVLALPLQLRGPMRRRVVAPGGREIAVLEIGRAKATEPLCARLFGELPAPEYGASRSLRDPAAAAGAAHLVVAEVHRWLAPRFRRAGWVVVPGHVRWEGDLAQLPPPEMSRSLKDDLRKVRSRGFTLGQAGSEADWDEFTARMLAPHASARFGDDAWLPSPYLMRRFRERGQLHFVRHGAARVGGFCSLRSGGTIWIPLSGVRDGDPALLRAGVSIAGYALGFEWARRQGCTRVDMGRTSPFFNDGVQQYKRKWGLTAVADPLAHLTAVWVGSDAARLAFAQQPVLAEGEQGLWIYAGGGL
jgi:Acetyltransferase (GNAT) domain